MNPQEKNPESMSPSTTEASHPADHVDRPPLRSMVATAVLPAWTPEEDASSTRPLQASATAVLTPDQLSALGMERREALPTSTVALTAEQVAQFRAAAPPPPPLHLGYTAALPAAELPSRSDRFIPRDATASSSIPPVSALPAGGARLQARPNRAGAVLAAALALGGVIVLGVSALVGVRVSAARSGRWIAPTIVAKSDPRVLEVATALDRETARASELELQRKRLTARLEQVEHGEGLEMAFQSSYDARVTADLQARRAELDRLRGLRKLIAQIEVANGKDDLSAERRAELEVQLEAAQRRVALLEGVLPGAVTKGLTELSLRREYELSRAQTEQLRKDKVATKLALTEVDASLGRTKAILESLSGLPFRAAMEKDTVFAFVPYENMQNARDGARVVSCTIGELFCSEVGTLGREYAPEVQGTHPMSGQTVRGKLLGLQLSDAKAAARPALFVRQAK